MTIVVCDSGPLLHLWEIELWPVFGIFETMHLATQVVEEVEKYVGPGRFEKLTDCTVHIHLVSLSKIESARTNLPPKVALQPADLATLVLAQEVTPHLVLTDDLALRRTLEAQGQTPMGSVGILLGAYKAGLLDAKSLDQAIDGLFVHSTLYLSPQFKAHVRKLIMAAIGSR